MRYIMTALAALSLGALPIVAQVPARPAQPTPPAQPAGPPAQLTEQQRQQHQAIREKFAKDFQAHRDAMQALNEKMRTEIEATLTPDQRQARQQGAARGLGLGGGRGVGLGQAGGRGVGLGQGGGRGVGLGQAGGRKVGLGQGGGQMGAMAPGNGQLQPRAMLWNRADRAARQVIAMRDRMAGRALVHQRGARRMVQPGMLGRRGAMMGQGAMMGRMGQGATVGGLAPRQPAPKVVKPLPAKPTTGGGD